MILFGLEIKSNKKKYNYTQYNLEARVPRDTSKHSSQLLLRDTGKDLKYEHI